jgi:Zn-dependent peptidase ImmA (M78 family)
MKPSARIAEDTAEAFAADFLEQVIDSHVFIGAYIEQVLAKRANLIFQYVEDDTYYGVAIKHMSGEAFIALNSYQPLRMRYFTAAHELWHLSEASKWQVDGFDHERAADRFAAAIMLPKSMTKEIWEKLKDNHDTKTAIIYLADMAQVPYVAVVRRLRELHYRFSDLSELESDWREERKHLGIAPSPLDQAQRFESFSAYEQVVVKAVEEERLTRLSAANKLSVYRPDLARALQEDEISRLQEDATDD